MFCVAALDGIRWCARCGSSPAVRSEQVHVEFATQAKLLASANELESFGVTVEKQQLFWKVMGAPRDRVGVGLNFDEPLDGDVLRELVLYLQYLAIPEEEILRLRLDEPEKILTLLSKEQGSRVNATESKRETS